jgi:hypothetical protein
MSRLGATIIAGAVFALGTIFAVRAENIHLVVWTTPLLAMVVLRSLRLQWSDLAKAVLFSTLIMSIEWKQAAVLIGLMQMLGVSLLILIDPKARQMRAKAHKVEVKEIKVETEAKVEIETETETKIEVGVEAKEPTLVVENIEKTEKSEHGDVNIAIPGGKIFMAALSIPALIVFLGGGVNEDTVQIALLVSMGLSIFLGLLALVLSLLKEVRTSAIAGATGALLFYASYFYLFLMEGMQR